MKQVAAAVAEQFIAMLPEEQQIDYVNKDIYQQTAKMFNNISKEAERTRKAFEAGESGVFTC